MIFSLRERLTLGLIALLPFHALFVTAFHQFLGSSAPVFLWKEIVLVVILFLSICEIFAEKKYRSVDALDILLVGIFFFGVVRSLTLDVPLRQLLFGLKYDFLAPLSFLLLRRVLWSISFQHSLQKILLIDAVILCLYGISTLFLPDTFFAFLGYSDLHSLYIPNAALAPFQYLEASDIRRVQSAMSGPNQFGIWLLIPLSILVSQWKNVKASGYWLACPELVERVAIGFLLCTAIFLTFSRSAWIAGCFIISLSFFSQFLQNRKTHFFVFLFGILSIGVVSSFLFRDLSASVLLRTQSSLNHFKKPIDAISVMIDHPLGLGLGSAGPASNAVSDACVFLPKDADASWAKAHSNLCVLKGDTQVQPSDHTCSCPVLTENWYLQWGVEMGVLGFLTSLFIPFFLFKKYWKHQEKRWILFAYVAVSIAGLFLHSFEDSAVAYTVWMLLSML
jgi:hypothetical protein